MRLRLPLFCAALLLGFCSALKAQVSVDLKMQRRSFMAYEPLVATVSIMNLSGRDLILEDTPTERWFSFQIYMNGDQIVPPRNRDYHLSPLRIGAGETVQRQVNLVDLYPVTDYGTYRLQASIYLSETQKYYSSPELNVSVGEGKLIWHQAVGAPQEQGGTADVRQVSLLVYRPFQSNRLYVRIEDQEKNIVYCAFSLGKLMDGSAPQVLLDNLNRLNVMHSAAPKTFVHSVIGLGGELVQQHVYTSTKTRPEMRKGSSGEIAIFGGRREEPQVSGTSNVPKISDRPADLPK